ncbi:MAG: hypothetical protein IPM69_05945 [Ignavibacteria bacterium]|nr:hypothetical protein [Ignavibacteria bacterium]
MLYLRIYLSILTVCLMITPLLAQDPTALAPILVGPYDGKDVAESQIVWTWFVQAKASGGNAMYCDLIVVEILEGQTPEEALRLNPPVILKENLTSTSWQTNPAVRNLHHGKRYAWHIIAKINKNLSAEPKNQKVISSSEIWTFVYHDPTEPLDESAIGNNSSPIPTNESISDEQDSIPQDINQDSLSEMNTSKNSPLEFNGTARYIYTGSNRKGNLSVSPAISHRLEASPTLKLFGVPLGMNFLLSTEENLQQSDISRGAFGSQNTNKGLNLVFSQRIDEKIREIERARDSAGIDSLRILTSEDSLLFSEKITALQQLRTGVIDQNLELLREFDVMTPEQEILSQFPSFGVGKVSPKFGTFLFNNVTINGGMIEYNPGNIYLAASAGKVQRQVELPSLAEKIEQQDDSTLLQNPLLQSMEFYRNIYSARVGYGRKNGNYIALTGMYGEDDEESLFMQSILNRPIIERYKVFDTVNQDTDSTQIIEKPDSLVSRTNTLLSPQKNFGFGTAGHFALDSARLICDFEFNLMYLQDIPNYPSLRLIPSPQSLPEMFKFDEKYSTITDFNFMTKASYSLLEDTKLAVAVRYVGGGFRSFGVAGMRTDVLNGNVFYEHKFLSKQMRFKTSFSYDEAGFKDSVNHSIIRMVNSSLDLRFRGLPALTIDYSRHFQTLETDKKDTIRRASIHNSINQWFLTATHLFGHNDIRVSSYASIMYKVGTTSGSQTTDSSGIFTSTTFLASNRISFGKYIALGLMTNYSATDNHPMKSLRVQGSDGADSLTETVLSVTSESYTGDISLLFTPYNCCEATIGSVATYLGGIARPGVIGGYCSARVEVGSFGTLEMRFDYRESQAQDFKKTFALERTGRIIMNVRW